MEISFLKVLLKNISCFFHISSHENINFEPVQKYYQRVEELLKLLKPVLDAIISAEVASDEPLQKLFSGFSQSFDVLREFFENCYPLMSRFYFVVQVESLIEKVRNNELEILELLKSFDGHLPVEISAPSLEHYVEKLKHIGHEQMSSVITKAIRDQVEGSGPSSESLTKIADYLSLMSSQELLIEAVALEKLKENAEQTEKNGEVDYIDQMISLATYMYDRHVMMKQSQSCNPVPIPPDFCCPLSLELMADPVIVASGQTYERAFIRKWIHLGLSVCPKTRQTLAHTNLIPNYTVKALIANWCELNNVKLPDPMKSMSLNQPSFLLKNDASGGPGDSNVLSHSRGSQPMSPDLSRSSGLAGERKSYNEVAQDGSSLSHHHSSSEDSVSGLAVNGVGSEIERSSLKNSEDRLSNSSVPVSMSPSRKQLFSAAGDEESSSQGPNRTTSASSARTDSKFSQGMLADRSEASSQATVHRGDASGEAISDPKSDAAFVSQQRDPEFPSQLETRSRSQTIWRRPSERFVPRIISSPSIETRPDLSGVESQVRNLVGDLKSDSLDAQRNATAELRLLAKHNMDNRIVIASCGTISLLVDLLRSTDTKIQENAVTALLNLSINDNNKTAIANAEAIDPLIHVLQTGSPEAKENSAATLFSLSVIEDNKVRIGRSGAIKPLVDLLGNGTPRGKKDASTALFNLSIFHENKARIVQAGAVKYLVELMDPAAGMVDKAVAVLSNLSTIPEGRAAIGQEGGIPLLVEVVELGSARGKENAAAALLQLCTNSSRFCNMVLQEGAVPPLVALSQSGTPRAKEKAQALLTFFRNQRHGNAGRG